MLGCTECVLDRLFLSRLSLLIINMVSRLLLLFIPVQRLDKSAYSACLLKEES